MKKNLRIVSAAAAALLAVAPVAASAVSVNAAANTTVSIGNSLTPLPDNSTVNLSSSLSGVVSMMDANTPYPNTFHVSGSISASLAGSNFSAILPADANMNATANTTANQGKPGQYTVAYPENTSINFGTANANKEVTISVPKGMAATVASDNYASGVTDASKYTTDGSASKDIKVKINKNGLLTFSALSVKNVKVVNSNDATVVLFFNKQNGQPATTGSVTVYAGNDAKMNVSQIVTEFNKNYTVGQLNNEATTGDFTVSANEIAKELRAQNIAVDANGYFTAPKSFNLNILATSNTTNAKATMALTVNVPNGKDTTPAAVPSTGNVTIMHAAYTYEIKDGKLGSRVTSADTLHAYSEIPVYGTVTVNGKKYYRVSATQDYYINAGNVDGTSRSLKHNSYVYNNKGKRVKSEGTWKKGSKHTTYGAAMNIKGNRMYRVNKNRYVKVVNFD
ncbi:SLAP domain-containing protein [Lactobacillus amylovorus]|uniref:SLAP domain-containing protein n=1 Tax=Lactobacillus amylovorus TaxID=1604 RepID=UPI003F89504A